MEKKLDKRNFRKKALATEGLRELNEFTKSSSKRPARLYTFESIKLNSKRAHFISKKIEDYEVREDGMVKWVVREHTFNWQNPLHVRALLNNYNLIYEYLHDEDEFKSDLSDIIENQELIHN